MLVHLTDISRKMVTPKGEFAFGNFSHIFVSHISHPSTAFLPCTSLSET